MTPQELKNSILQLAIQGKLVEQRAEEGTAAELLEKIARHGTHKTAGTHGTKSRAAHRASSVPSVSSVSSVPVVSPIPDDEKPFDIPESWEWVRLGDVVSLLSGRDLEPSEYSATPKKYPYMTGASNFANGILLVNRWTDRPVTISHIGDLLITCKGTVGAMAFNAIGDIHIARQIMAISSASIDLHYVKVFLAASVQSLKAAANSMIPGIDRKTMLFRPIPLPPLAEQMRIVAKIEELLPLIDRYEKAWSKLEDFNKRFPVDMQKSLLQMAIQGKLVEQRAEEGTAAELVEKILAAKNAKGAKKNSRAETQSRREKKSSALSASPREEIPDDEKPYDIPESWEWVRLGDLGSLKSGYAFKSTEYTKDGIQVVRISDLRDDSIGLKDAVFYPRKPELSQYLVIDGSFLICMTGSIGKMAWVKDSVLRYLNQRVGMFIPNALCSSTYLWFFLHTSYVIDKWISAKTSTNGNIKNSDIVELLIPLPPLAEQKRIVAKLEELLPLCE